jgi:hypothetical protein
VVFLLSGVAFHMAFLLLTLLGTNVFFIPCCVSAAVTRAPSMFVSRLDSIGQMDARVCDSDCDGGRHDPVVPLTDGDQFMLKIHRLPTPTTKGKRDMEADSADPYITRDTVVHFLPSSGVSCRNRDVVDVW